MKINKLYFVAAVVFMAGCTHAPQRYGISAENNNALKALNAKNVNVGSFVNTSNIENNCRGIYGALALPDKLSFEGYLQKALQDELKVAGAYGNTEKSVTLTGNIEKLAFSTLTSITGGGSWDIGLRVKSSNGKEVYVTEHYEYDGSMQAWIACGEAASAYQPAVQNVLGKLFNSKEFKEMLVK
jgi:hypothetical protein